MTEIVFQLILYLNSFLKNEDILICYQVNKQWKSIIEKDNEFWTYLILSAWWFPAELPNVIDKNHDYYSYRNLRSKYFHIMSGVEKRLYLQEISNATNFYKMKLYGEKHYIVRGFKGVFHYGMTSVSLKHILLSLKEEGYVENKVTCPLTHARIFDLSREAMKKTVVNGLQDLLK